MEKDYHAEVVIYELSELNLKDRKKIIEWLEECALQVKWSKKKKFAQQYSMKLMK